MPEKYRNSVIFGSIHGCSVKQNILKPNGSSYTASRGDDFLVSGDKNVRPLNMRWGPLGDIYLSDWHDQNPCHQALPDSWDYERGRIYRVQLKGTKPKKAEDLGKKSPTDLVRLIRDGNPYESRTSLRLLGEAATEKKMEAVVAVTRNAKDMTDFQAVCAAHAVVEATGKQPSRVPFTATSPDDKDLSWPVRVRSQSAGFEDESLRGFSEVAARSTVPATRRELASAAVRLADRYNVTEIIHALLKHKEDAKDPLIPHLVWLAYEKVLAERAVGKKLTKSGFQSFIRSPVDSPDPELTWLANAAPGNPFVTDFIIPRTMRRLVATGKPDMTALCVGFAFEVDNPQTRRKALEGLTVALDGQVVDAPAKWAEWHAGMRKTADAETKKLLDKLAVNFRDPEAMKRAYATVHDAKLPSAERIEALRQVVVMKHPDALSTVGSALRQEIDLKVRAEAARQLAAFDGPRIGADIVRDWKMIPKEIQADVVTSLASRKEWARSLLTAMKEKKIDRTAATDATITRIQGFKDAALDKLIEEAWGKTRSTPAELLKQIDAVRKTLDEGPASFAKGKLVFDTQCAKCHVFDGRGSDVGPALDGAARDVEYLLANVIDPNRVVGAPYFIRQARTLDGQVIQGLLAEEDDRFISLKIEQGQVKKIAKKDLDGEVKVLEKSMMPEGLAAGMTPQDFRDLVRYAMANPFLTHVTVNGNAVAVGPRGYLPLPNYKDGDVIVIEAKVTAATAVKTKLLIGSLDAVDVKVDGKTVGGAAGGSGNLEPDREATPVELTKGEHTIRLEIEAHKGKGVYARFLDPERKLTYPESP
jgi:putative heme-binding domain-containing protein